MTEAERKSILDEASYATTSDEATGIIENLVKEVVGGRQVHHPISGPVYKELQRHRKLRGKYRHRDARFEALASSNEAHRGLQEWHRALDAEIATWIRQTPDASQQQFEKMLRKRYGRPDLKDRFPSGF